MALPDPDQLTRVVGEDGRLTRDGWLLLRSMVEYMRTQDAGIAALAAVATDHETRIADLEP
jgi:hypothetical protein